VKIGMFSTRNVAVCIASLMWGVSAHALPITTGAIEYDGDVLPNNLWRNAYESDTTIWLWHESTVLLTSDQRVNWGGDIVIGGNPHISAGQEVNAFLLHHDVVGQKGNRLQGTATFETEIIGLIFRHQLLINTDALFGQAHVNYWNNSVAADWRGLELPNEDSWSVSADGLTLTLNSYTKDYMDEVRVITRVSAERVPDGGLTAGLMGLSLLLLCFIRKRMARA